MAKQKTCSITVSKALKLKGRLVGKIASIEGVIRFYNSVEDSAEKFDTASALELHKELKSYLIELKSRISLANAPVQSIIYELAEMKADIVFYSTIPTKQGEFSQGYGSDEKVRYVSIIRKVDIDERVANLQARIDELQDTLDENNAKITIEVDEKMLTEATSPLDKKWYKD